MTSVVETNTQAIGEAVYEVLAEFPIRVPNTTVNAIRRCPRGCVPRITLRGVAAAVKGDADLALLDH